MTEAVIFSHGVLALMVRCWLAPKETEQPVFSTSVAFPLLETRIDEPSITGVPLLARETMLWPLKLTVPLTF